MKKTRLQGVLKKGVDFVRDNKVFLLQIAIMAIVLVPKICLASKAMPWDSGISSLKDDLTGPLPRAASLISIAIGGGLYAMGQSDISRIGMKCAFGTAIACGAPTLGGLFGLTEASGSIF